MSVAEVVQSPLLVPCLNAINATITQTTQIIDFLTENASSPVTTDLQTQVARQQKLLTVYLSKLRLQSRRAAFAGRTTKAETTEARKQIDDLLLQLQNLYYEQRHLLGEIAACEDYTHAFRELPLLDKDEYLSRFPEQDDLTEEELMPKRIEYEALERRRMEEERAELSRIKEKLVAENSRRKEEMKKMDEKLEAWVDGLNKLDEDLRKDL